METQVQTTAAPTPPALTQDKGWDSGHVDSADVLIPKILLMQGLSRFVAEGSAQQGQIVDSVSRKVLAQKDQKLEFIPLKTHKTWLVEEKEGGKFAFRYVEPMNEANSTLPTEWTLGTEGEFISAERDQGTWRRSRSLNFIVLVVSDIAKETEAFAKAAAGGIPDVDDCLLPLALTFRRTGYSAGKELVTHFKKAEHFKMPACVKTFKLGAKLEKNTKGTFHIFTVEPSRSTTPEELAVCKRWNDMLKGTAVKVDESDESGGEPAPVDGTQEQF